ncbi:MAG: RNA polymerase sigma factor [Fibrobacteres bacterium]|nr:RNA polymerase sigma factor [Fibrobacterota bacterium]
MDRTEIEFIQLAQKGQNSAFEQLIELHKDALYKWCYSLTKEPEDALDLAQEAFIKAHNKIHLYKPDGSFRAWLIRIAYRQFLNLKEKQRRRESNVAFIEEELMFTAKINNERETHMDTRNLISEAIELLPEDYRSCITMRYVGDLSVRDIAISLKLTETNVKVRLFRAKSLLAKAIAMKKTEVL